MVARLAPIDPPYEPDIAKTLSRLMGSSDAEPLKLFRTVAHNPAILDKFRSTGTYLLNFGTLDPADRELVILRTCARCGSEYEWGVHATVFAESVGLTSHNVAATVRATNEDGVWTDRQRLLVRLVDEIHERSNVPDDVWDLLRNNWNEAQLVELVALIGQYHTVSYFTNVFGVELEEDGARFPRP